MKKELLPQDWGLTTGDNSQLYVQGYNSIDLAGRYGTPLHVINEPRLAETALKFRSEMENAYNGRVSAHYAFKCNSVPYVAGIIKSSGMGAEVTNDYELQLAFKLGYSPRQIIVNGPNKSADLLSKCLVNDVRLIVADSIEELRKIRDISAKLKLNANILLRINPDYIPAGMNSGSATGSRKGSLFGLDLNSNEVTCALMQIFAYENLRFKGFHFHIGTGINNPGDYSNVIHKLSKLLDLCNSLNINIEILDVGGGISSPTSRELTSAELLLYQGFNYLPLKTGRLRSASFKDFGRAIAGAVYKYFPQNNLPELIFEPGRSIVSQNQFLLLKVHQVKYRKGAGIWLITDGGLGTVSMPTYYEYHEVFLCNDVFRPKSRKVSINGSCCFAADIIYKNKLMPEIRPGEILAVMDSGAYFTALESQFGFQRPAIISVNGSGHKLVRRRETIDDMISRDSFFTHTILNEVTA